VLTKNTLKAHDLGFLRLEVIRETMRQAGDDPQLANAAFKAHEVGVAKPDIKIYQAATSYLALDANQVMHIGDDAHTDAWGAREAGLHAVWINAYRTGRTTYRLCKAR